MLFNTRDVGSDEKRVPTQRVPFPWQMSEQMRDRYRRAIALMPVGSAERSRFCVGITSCFPGEGVTFTAARLACAWAEQGSDVVVVEASPSSRTLAKEFGLGPVHGTPGPSDLVLRLTAWANLHVAPRETGLRHDMGLWLDERSAAVTVVDCGALESGPQLLELAPHLNGFLLVMAAGIGQTRQIRAFLREATRTGLPCLGTILNKI